LRGIVRRAIARRSYCTLATSSAANRPHVAGVLYAVLDGLFYISTLETSTKARNIRENPRVAVCIPVRRYPVGPPFAVHFQGTAELRRVGDREMVELLAAGRPKPITSHGELDDPHACFVKVTPGRRMATYGLGVPLRKLLRDPTQAGGSVEMR
jgi:general stress protein 26